MRARLLVIVLVVVGLVAAGLGGLLAWTTAQAAQEGFFTRRLTDTVHLASLVQRPLTDAAGADLDALLDRYRQVYGVSVYVVTADGTPFAPSAPAAPLDATARERLDAALAGRRSEPPPLQMPWDGAPLVIAEPVLVDGEVRGAVVTVSPTTALHERELRTWALIAAAVLLALALGVLVSLPVVRWILHPVRRLDEGTGRVASRRPRGRRGRARRRRQRAAGAAPALRVVRPDGRDGDRRARGAARVRRRREPPAAQPADRAAAAAVEPERARRRRGGRRPRRRAGGGRAALGAARRAARAGPDRAHRAAGRRRRRRRGGRPGRGLAAARRAHRAAPGLRRAAGPDGGGTGRSRGDRARRRAGQRGEVLRAGGRDHGAHRAARRPGGDRRPGHRPGARARRAGAGHGPVLAQPLAEQRGGLGAGPGHRGADGRAGRRVAARWSRPTAAGCGWWRGCRSRRVRTPHRRQIADGPLGRRGRPASRAGRAGS